MRRPPKLVKKIKKSYKKDAPKIADAKFLAFRVDSPATHDQRNTHSECFGVNSWPLIDPVTIKKKSQISVRVVISCGFSRPKIFPKIKESKVVTQVCSKNANFRQHNSSSLAWQMCVLIITINPFKLQIHMQLVGMWVPRNYSDLWGNVPYLFVSTFCTFASLARFSHGLTVDSGNQNKILWSERVPCPSPHQAIQSITNSAASNQIK